MKKIFLLLSAIVIIALTGCSASDSKNEKSSNQKADLSQLDITDENTSTEEKPETEDVVANISSESTWAYDVTDPLVVKENTDYLLKVKVKTKEKTKYFIKNAVMPASTYNLEVLEVLLNDDGSVPKNIKLAVNGGIVSMQDYVNTMDEDTKSKTNVNKLSQKELMESVLISDESYYEMKQGQEYYIFVRDLTNDENYKEYFGMPEGGYDVFEEKEGGYVNVLTKKKL